MLEYSPPPAGAPTPFVVSTFSRCCLGDVLTAARSQVAVTTYPLANVALFYPIRLTEGRTFTGVLWENGTVVSGNVNAAIYNTDGSLVTGSTMGSAAQSGTSTTQQKAFSSPVTLGPGTYFLAFACDNTTATFARSSYGNQFERLAGVRQLASFFALTGSAAAWIGTGQAFVPLIALYEASWL